MHLKEIANACGIAKNFTLQAHYERVEYHPLSGDAKDELFSWFFLKEKMLVVIGSDERSALSTFSGAVRLIP
jgi:hypothetical protein